MSNDNSAIKPKMGGFNLALDLTNVKTKGGARNNQDFDPKLAAGSYENEVNMRSSLGNSDQAHPIEEAPPYKDNVGFGDDSDSSSSGYGFVPPPELNPNRYVPNKDKKPGLGLGGTMGFKLNLNNVEGANQITKEDRSRIQELGKKPDTFSNTVHLKLDNPDAKSPPMFNLGFNNSTSQEGKPAPKFPGLGLGGGFKLDLAKVPTANVITDEDKEKMKQVNVPTISKNNFTETNTEVKGNKPRKLNLKGKDSTTKLPSESSASIQNIKASKGKRAKKVKAGGKLATRLGKFEKSSIKKSNKVSRNMPNKSLVLENSDMDSLFDSESGSNDNKAPVYKRKMRDDPSEKLGSGNRNLTPNMTKDPISSSHISQISGGSSKSKGSYVGTNRVFIPSLNIQEDVINKELESKQKLEEEKRAKRLEDQANPRFKMQKVANKKGFRNLLSLNDSKQNTLKVDTQVGSPEAMQFSSSKDFTIVESGSKKDTMKGPFNPLALNLSKMPKQKQESSEFKTPGMLIGTQQASIPRLNIANENAKNEMTVTLAPNVDNKFEIAPLQDPSRGVLIKLNPEYEYERSSHGIYMDEELHCLMIFLIFSLILTPERGTLDDLYCSRKPLEEDKPHVLHYLHYHLNHIANQPLIPKILKKVESKFTQYAGIRLMKLLCKTLFDRNLYTQDNLIAKGAYGNVYECATECQGTSTVAIKQMNFPSSIDKRCVLYDIFSEVHIACVDVFKSNPAVVDVYDYGVDSNGYHLVMKRYKYSLKEWRKAQTKSLKENLSVYLTLYKDILKAVELLHDNNVTHYDIKADNVFLDVIEDGNLPDGRLHNFIVALGDFGECKMFISQEDEFCEKNRGTELFMSPEMFMLAINTRKDTEKYDRRKKMGTNRLSDIWSLGCLFYELLTGELLFKSSDELFVRV